MAPDKLSTEERLDIQDFFSRYCFLIDQIKGDAWAAMFTVDAVFEIPGLASLTGRDQIRQVVDMVGSKSQGRWRHQITNLVSEPDGEGGAAFVMYGIVTDWSGAGAVSTFSDYSGRLRKIDGEWRIVQMTAKPLRITV